MPGALPYRIINLKLAPQPLCLFDKVEVHLFCLVLIMLCLGSKSYNQAEVVGVIHYRAVGTGRSADVHALGIIRRLYECLHILKERCFHSIALTFHPKEDNMCEITPDRRWLFDGSAGS